MYGKQLKSPLARAALGDAVDAGEKLAGRYRLDRRLGHGGMGEVWSATDLRLDRAVAVKVMLADMTGEGAGVALAWFRREGKATARPPSHPHIAVIHDVGEHGARPYLVMEFLRGPDLRKLLRDAPGGLPVEVALEYGAQAAEGLAAAHAAGVVHRDVSPANLILDQAGRVKVCDFGIASLKDGTRVIGETTTVVGNIAYMAPEQFGRQSVTGAADVYALGATLFHLVTGRVPFLGEELPAAMAEILMDPPPAPSTLRPGVPPPLDSYLLSMLAKDPCDRPSMDSIPAALRRIASVRHAQAEALLAEAEDLILSNLRAYRENMCLAIIAEARAIWDPEQAERTARLIQTPSVLAKALLRTARVTARRDRDRAAGLLAAAELAALAIPWEWDQPDDYLASEETLRVSTLREIARVAAAWAPAEAVRIAQSLPDHGWGWRPPEDGRSETFAQLAAVVAERHPDTAQQIAYGIGGNPYYQARALCAVAGKIVTRDPGRAVILVSDAEEVVRELPARPRRGIGFVEMARVLLDADPDRAGRLLAEAQDIERSLGDDKERSWASRGTAADLRLRIVETAAALDIAAAHRFATGIDDEHGRLDALILVAVVAAARDLGWSQSIAALVADNPHDEYKYTEWSRVHALIQIAEGVLDTAPEHAAGLLAMAENLARTQRYGHSHSDLLDISLTLAQIDLAGAVRIADEAGADPSFLSRLQCSAARAMGRQDPAQAAKLRADAERNARRIADHADRARVLIDVASSQVGLDHVNMSYPAPLDRRRRLSLLRSW